jgi:cation:H+ antiporter
MIEYLLLVLGLVLLVKGADFLVDGSSSLAKKFGISSLAVGLTVVAFGTSLPELMVNIYASLNGASEISFGNIIGSNIANILLILGICSIVSVIKFNKSTVWKEIPFALLAVILFFVLSNKSRIEGVKGGFITLIDGVVLLLFFLMFLYYVYELAKEKKLEVAKDVVIHTHSNLMISLMIIAGIVALYFGGEFTVKGAITIARQLGISELLISSTIIAIGTSLPELVTSILALVKKESELSVGNIVGSNIFNILFIIGISALISPIAVPALINFDFVFLFAATILLFAFLFVSKKHELKRWHGIIFILVYIAYIVFLIHRG